MLTTRVRTLKPKRRSDPDRLVGVIEDAFSGFEGLFYFRVRDGQPRPAYFTVRHDPREVNEVAYRRALRRLPIANWSRAALYALVRKEARTDLGKRGEVEGAAARYAAIADEYRELLAQGFRDPSSEIARRHRVKSVTARQWVYRARQRGFLHPAEGPHPGERFVQSD